MYTCHVNIMHSVCNLYGHAVERGMMTFDKSHSKKVCKSQLPPF